MHLCAVRMISAVALLVKGMHYLDVMIREQLWTDKAY